MINKPTFDGANLVDSGEVVKAFGGEGGKES